MDAANSSDPASVGDRVRRLRESRGWSQARLSAVLTAAGVEGIHPQTVTRIEAGQRPLRFHEATVLAAALDVSLGVLAGSEGDAHVAALLSRLAEAAEQAAEAIRLLRHRREAAVELVSSGKLPPELAAKVNRAIAASTLDTLAEHDAGLAESEEYTREVFAEGLG